MGPYVVRRLLQLIPVFFGTTLFIYFMVFKLPGDPIQALAGDNPVSPSVEHALRQRYHLDDPFIVQYGKYLGGILRGDLGEDFTGQQVSTYIARAWPITLRLALTAWSFTLVFGLLLGVVASVKRGFVDRLILGVSTLPLIVPSFVLAFTAQILLGVNVHLFPVAGIEQGWPYAYLLPAMILGFYGLAGVARLTRASMLEHLRADFTRTAIAKGLPRRKVVLKHVLRNSLIPVVTYLGIDLGGLLAGAVFVEGVFNLPGMGGLIFQSIQQQNGPVVVGVSTLIVLVYLVANLAVDLLYGVIDPRIHYD